MGVQVFNHSTIEQRLVAGETAVAVPPGERVEVPFSVADAFRDRRVEGLYFDFDATDHRYLFRDAGGRIAHLAYLSPFIPWEGYGICGLKFVQAAERAGIRISIPRQLDRHITGLLEYSHPDVHRVLLRQPENCLWGIMHGVPSEFQYLKTPGRIGHTMFEADRIPKAWVDPCNAMRGLIVPSHGQATIFIDSAVTAPIRVVPDPIDLADWMYTPKDRPGDPFTFVTFSRMSERKMPLELIDCFRRAFPERRDVRLVLKTHSDEFGQPYGQRANVPPGFHPHGDERITVVNEQWPVARLYEWLSEADCFVGLSHGEGQFNPPLQAMAVGVPTIVVDHSGCSDYADPNWCWPVRTGGKSRTDLWNCRARWWEPDLDHCVEQMRSVVDQPDLAYRKRLIARRHVEEEHAPAVHLRRMLAAIEALVRPPVALRYA